MRTYQRVESLPARIKTVVGRKREEKKGEQKREERREIWKRLGSMPSLCAK